MELYLSWLRKILLACLLVYGARACSPGTSSRTGKEPRVTTPLKLKQRVPNISEDTLGASGPSEGIIERDSTKFEDLSSNNNADIQFKDEEGTGADRMMSKRCKDKLNALAISVMNRWPGVKLRVIEAWDEDGHHSEDSLHYEGRAVDLTTSDRDKDKYGMLARMAVDAGFDWVYYEQKNWIHASVKSDSSEAARSGGCFPIDSLVTMETGERRTLNELRVGDRVQAIDSKGEITYSDVIMFLHRKPLQNTLFYVIETEDKQFTAVLTPQHLIYVSDSTHTNFSEARAVFASHVKTGQFLYTTVQDHDREDGALLRQLRITRITVRTIRGAVAPLTRHGTLVVDNVAVSSYAVIKQEWIAHAAFFPVRIYYSVRQYFWGTSYTESNGQTTPRDYVNWYSYALYRIGETIIKDYMHPQAIDL